MKFGADIRSATNLRVPSDANRSGQFNFSHLETSDGGVGGNALASLLLGDVSSYDRFASTSLNAEEHQWRYFFYGQDSWRITPKLTVNYGLRWELYAPETINEKGLGGLGSLTSAGVIVAGYGGNSLNFNVKNDLTAFAPRLGVAYQLDEKTVIRMGYGRSYDIGVFGSNFGHVVSQNLPVLVHQNIAASALIAGATDNNVPAFTLATGAPPVSYPVVPSNGLLPLRGFDGTVDPRIRPPVQTLPTIDTWNLTLQRQITSNTTLEIAYVGNKGSHTFVGNGPAYNINNPSIVGYGVLSQAQRRPFYNSLPYVVPETVTEGGVVYPQGTIIPCCSSDLGNYFGNNANSNYNALQVKAERRMSKGLQFITHYTWSRALNYDSSYFVDDPHIAYGPDFANRNHVFVANIVYDLPFGRGRSFAPNASKALDYLIGGWEISSTSNWSSGLPFTPSTGFCGSEEDVGVCRPDKGSGFQMGAGNFNPVSHTVTFYTPVNVDAGATQWLAPGVGNLGNAGVLSLNGPRLFTSDATIMKNFSITERVKAQFRMDAFNVFNHPVLGFSSTQGNTCVAYNNANSCGGNPGVITDIESDTAMRALQFAVRLNF